MTDERLTPELLVQLKIAQRNEITEHRVYTQLSRVMKGEGNKKVLEQIAADELKHYRFWQTYTGVEMKPAKWLSALYYYMARTLGVTFTLRLMEAGEGRAQVNYTKIAKVLPETKAVIEDEERHELDLIEVLDEEKLEYVGAIVLGLNDALVELTGALAGFTFALQETRVIALAGLVTGIAASLSMAASSYLHEEHEENTENSKQSAKAAFYTGGAYLITVAFLILPYLFIQDAIWCLVVTVAIAIFIIFVFNFYVSIAQNINFKRQFFQMAAISLGVAVLSFGIGYVLRSAFGVEA